MGRDDKIVRLPDVIARTGLSSVTIWRKERAGTFPGSVKLGANSKGWYESEIAAWLENLPRVAHARAEAA